MDQLKKLLATLTLQQRIGTGLAAIAIFAALAGFVHWNHERDFRPLFTGMSPEDAAAIVQKLKESGVDYRIAENGSSVLVPGAKLDELRLEMAGAGLPKTGRVGFELFDKTNLGITDFTEHVNYRRALEGELERSIRALSEVEQARVHVTFPKDSVFVDSREPAKASVLIHLRPGAHLTPQNVLAITNLIASAVEGLAPENVSVLDMQGNLLSRPHKPGLDGSDMSEAALDYKRQIEKDLVAKVESTLDPLLGEGKFRVGVSADCDFSTSDQSDEIYDPAHSVMVNSQKSEDVSGLSQNIGVPGTPSNLPRAASRPANSGASMVSRRTENISYETSRTVRHVKTPQGGVKRISASLLLDQDAQWQGTGKQRKRILVPPSPEKLKAIHDVVAAVLGIVPERGDQLVIESLPFEETLEVENGPPGGGQPDSTSAHTAPLWADRRVLIGAGAGVVLLIGAAFFLLRRRKAPAAPQPAISAALPAGPSREELQQAREQEAARAIEQASLALDEKLRAQLPAATQTIEALRIRVREHVEKDPKLVAGVLRSWLDEPPGRVGLKT